uniref:Fibronectin type-III domain-containing protein n=1 Tax=Nothobranchius furzeri TaxID=105023 RepID=A0A8C6M676_NOTFU
CNRLLQISTCILSSWAPVEGNMASNRASPRDLDPLPSVVQWEPSQGQVDRYHLTVTPNDGAGQSQGMIIPPGQTSTHIQQLEAGRLYDVLLVAEKGLVHSQPATTQVVPGKYRKCINQRPRESCGHTISSYSLNNLNRGTFGLNPWQHCQINS